jgi:hypothetical protein
MLEYWNDGGEAQHSSIPLFHHSSSVDRLSWKESYDDCKLSDY